MFDVLPTAEWEGYIYNKEKQKGCPPGASPLCVSQDTTWRYPVLYAVGLVNNGKQITQTKGPDNGKPMTPTWECATLILTEPSTDRVSVRD